MDVPVWTADSDSEVDALQEADDFMGAACTVNISKGNATPDIKPPAIKKRRIIEAGKQEPVTQEDPGKSANALQVDSSTAKNFVGQILNPGGPEVQKKKKRKKKKRNKKTKNLIEDGQGQASKLVKESQGPQESQMPCAGGDSSKNKFQSQSSGQSLNKSSQLVKDQAVHAGEVPNHCAQCKITFRSPARLNRHCHKAHSTADSFRCPDCNKSFPNPGAVNQHRIVVHNTQNIYQCSQCNVIVKNASCLNQHHRIHHGFSKCSECIEEFSSLALLKQHQWEVHNIGKLLTCAVCSETFINFTKFMKHRKSHTYPCTVCNSTFKKPAQLKKHEKTHV